MKKLLILTSFLLMALLAGCADSSSDNGGASVEISGTITVPDQLGSNIEITNSVKQEEVWPLPLDIFYVYSQPIQNAANSVILNFEVGDPDIEPGILYNGKGTFTASVFKFDLSGSNALIQTPYTGTTRIAFLNKTQADELKSKLTELETIFNQEDGLYDYTAVQTICNEIIEMTKNDTFIYTLYVEK